MKALERDWLGVWTPPWPVIGRDQSIALGHKWYFTGEPCEFGHIARRYVCNWKCHECSRINVRSRQAGLGIVLRVDRRTRRTPESDNAALDVQRDYLSVFDCGAQITTIEQARRRGLATYFTGGKCPHGHEAPISIKKGRCVVCLKEGRAMWAARNPHKVKAYKASDYWKRRSVHLDRAKAYHLANPENAKRRSKDHYLRNKEAYSSASKQRYRLNPLAFKERIDAWRRANPDRVRVYRHARRARMQNAGGAFTAEDVARIRSAQRHRCAYCREKLSMEKGQQHADHIVPLVKGGSNLPANIQVLCPTCNCRKGASDPNDFARSIGRLI